MHVSQNLPVRAAPPSAGPLFLEWYLPARAALGCLGAGARQCRGLARGPMSHCAVCAANLKNCVE
eukprot:3468280-Pyramimonas_sp.AAC.1